MPAPVSLIKAVTANTTGSWAAWESEAGQRKIRYVRIVALSEGFKNLKHHQANHR